jgi:NTE family protein
VIEGSEALNDPAIATIEELHVAERLRQVPAGRIVLVLQGGGALGAYQAGVYEALHEGGIEPDWVIGTSIGAINGAIIAGNETAARLERLKDFWDRVAQSPAFDIVASLPWIGRNLPNWAVLANGVAGFFKPNPLAFLGLNVRLPADAAGYYSTKPLETTLTELVDFSRLTQCTPRLTVGAANLHTGEMHYFDTRDMTLTVRHVMASGALPPAFPAVRIDNEYYWDGGVLSNTPVEAVFDEMPRRDSLVFAVHMWNPSGHEPQSIWEIVSRLKDIQYSSRAVNHIMRQKQIHRLRHIIAEFAKKLPNEAWESDAMREMAAYGCLTQMHVVRLLAPPLARDDHMRDVDFSTSGIRKRWAAGYEDMKRVLAQAPWERPVDPVEGFHLHELRRTSMDPP